MSTVSSPARFSSDYDGFYDPNFTADISNKMRVPRRIRIVGNEAGDGDFMLRAMEPEKLDMMVPGRILVGGQDQHIGLKSPPRELHLEQSMGPQPSSIRVQTPPRVITLEEHAFPTVDEVEQDVTTDTTVTTHLRDSNSDESRNSRNNLTGMEQSLALSYPSTPPLAPMSDGVMSPTEELMFLRRHLAKLGRRVMVLEHENHQRQQREVVLYSLGVAYFFLKTLLWLHRHW